MPAAAWPPEWLHATIDEEAERDAEQAEAAWEAEEHALETAREATWDR